MPGWPAVAEGVRDEPIWEAVARYLRAKKTVPPVRPNRPRLVGVEGYPGLARPPAAAAQDRLAENPCASNATRLH
jgi:hypothetical protein